MTVRPPQYTTLRAALPRARWIAWAAVCCMLPLLAIYISASLGGPVPPLVWLTAFVPLLAVTAIAYIFKAHAVADRIRRPPLLMLIFWFVVVLNAASTFRHSAAEPQGSIAVINGEPVLTEHGRRLRKLSPDDVVAHDRAEVRDWAGFLLAFFALPGVGLLFMIQESETTDSIAPAV